MNKPTITPVMRMDGTHFSMFARTLTNYGANLCPAQVLTPFHLPQHQSQLKMLQRDHITQRQDSWYTMFIQYSGNISNRNYQSYYNN